MNLKPLHDQIIVRPVEKAAATSGGILLPANIYENSLMGDVVAVGAGKVMSSGNREPMEVSTGDRVLFGKYAGIEIEVEKEKLLIMPASDIVGIETKGEV